MNQPENYAFRQAALDREYAKAWEEAPEEWKRQASKMSISAAVPSYQSMSLEYQEAYVHGNASDHMPDMDIDSFVDLLIERHGGEFAEVIKAVADDYRKIIIYETERMRSLLLARVTAVLVQAGSKNAQARIHGLMHSIPRLASANGFQSMRASAKACGVSVEWIRKSRDAWCSELELPVPVEGRKSAEAKAKYKANSETNHWRKKICNRTKLSNLLERHKSNSGSGNHPGA